MQKESTNAFVMPNGVIVVTDFEPMDFVMNPATDDLIRGDMLREGMVVLLEGTHLRSNPEKFADEKTSPYARQRILETARWCTVTDIRHSRHNHDVLSFIGLYADGTKFERMYNESFTWFVKLDSIKTEEPEDDEQSMPELERNLQNACLKTDGCVLGVDHDGVCATPVDLVKDIVNAKASSTTNTENQK